MVNLEKINNTEITNVGLWFYLNRKKFFESLPIDILKLNSIMLISKISIWSKQIKSMGKTPIIYISKYDSLN